MGFLVHHKDGYGKISVEQKGLAMFVLPAFVRCLGKFLHFQQVMLSCIVKNSFDILFNIYYPPEVRTGKYRGLGVFLLQFFPLVKIFMKMIALQLHNMNIVSSKKQKIPQRQYSGHNTLVGHHAECGPMGLGQYDSLGEYCDHILPLLCFLY